MHTTAAAPTATTAEQPGRDPARIAVLAVAALLLVTAAWQLVTGVQNGQTATTTDCAADPVAAQPVCEVFVETTDAVGAAQRGTAGLVAVGALPLLMLGLRRNDDAVAADG